MKSKAEKRDRTQEAGVGTGPAVERVRQLLLGMVAGMAAAKHDLMAWVQEVGLAALQEVFEAVATAIAGPKGKHLADRTHHRWGTTRAELPFAGRRIQIRRPRVRSKCGQEAGLPSVARFQAEDPLPERVLNQILLGVRPGAMERVWSPPRPACGAVGRARARPAATWWSGWGRRCATTSPVGSMT